MQDERVLSGTDNTPTRHGRACPGHPSLNNVSKEGVDARRKAGHDSLGF
jgi:hypothetical protein